jgi:hypothetical protein
MSATRIDQLVTAKVWPNLQTFLDGHQLNAADPNEKPHVSEAAKQVRSRARSIPSLLRTSGFVVTLSMLKSRADARPGDAWVAKTLYSGVREFFPSLPDDSTTFIKSPPDPTNAAEVEGIAQIVAEVLKRSAEVLIPAPEFEE